MTGDPTTMRGAPAVALIYAAKSTADNGSIGTQLEDGRALAAREGLEVIAEYRDEAASAFKGNRGADLARAMADAERRAAAGEDVSLIVQHSDRLARGDGRTARHLVEVALWGMKAGVRIRSVQDPDAFPEGDYGLVLSSISGLRNNEDSKRKAAAVASGMARSRERGDAGWLARGIRPDGYLILREVGPDGKVSRTAIKDPERAEVLDLIWRLAAEGKSAPAIQLELARRGWRTASVRKDQPPRPFDVHAIDALLRNPAYAGLVSHRETRTAERTIVGEGDWPRYVEPEVFWRIQAERRERRGGGARRKPGRPPGGGGQRGMKYLLAGLATCGECGGPLNAMTYGKRRKDGTVVRRYHCPAHHEYGPGSPDHCPALPYDAAEADRLVLSGIDQLLADAGALREQLGAGRRVKREQLGKVAEQARKDAAAADRVADLARRDYATALERGDDLGAEIALEVAKGKARDAKAARDALNAALDALSVPQEADDADVLARVWAALSGRIRDAAGDVAALNAALRETFEEMNVVRGRSGLRVVPTLSAETLARMMREDRVPPAFRPGRLAAIHLDADGEQVAYDGDALSARTLARIELPAFEAAT